MADGQDDEESGSAGGFLAQLRAAKLKKTEVKVRQVGGKESVEARGKDGTFQTRLSAANEETATGGHCSESPDSLQGKWEAASIHGVMWERCCSLHLSAEGGSGVIFVRVADNSKKVVVVKGSSTIVQELFAARVGQAVGVPVPEMRMVQFTKPEWQRIKTSLGKIASETDRIKVKKELDRAFLIVMQYAEGVGLAELGSARASKLFARTDVNVALHDIGCLLGLDIVLNNWDRLPVLWENDGNPNNIIFSNVSGVWAIDQAVTSINPKVFASGLEKYLGKVHSFLEDIVRADDASQTRLSVILRFIQDYTGFAVLDPRQACACIRHGLITALCRLASLDLTKERENIGDLVKANQDWAEVWAGGVRAINIEFLEAIQNELKTALSLVFQHPTFGKMFGDQQHDDVKVMIFQCTPTNNDKDLVRRLDESLTEEFIVSGRAADIFLLPESCIVSSGAAQLEKHPSLSQLANLCRKHCVFGVLGTFRETTLAKKIFNTAAFLDRNGKLLAFYRKRKPLGDIEAGTEECVVDTEIGRIAVLICHDIERQDILMQTLGHKPLIILNPVEIPPPSHLVKYPSMVAGAWRTAMDTVARKLERHARESGVTFIRCDRSFENCGGSGTSLVVGPNATVQAPTALDGIFCVLVPRQPCPTLTHPIPERQRTEWIDNTGNRFLLQPLAVKGTQHILAIQQKMFVTASDDGVVQVWALTDFIPRARFECKEEIVMLASADDSIFVATKTKCLIMSQDLSDEKTLFTISNSVHIVAAHVSTVGMALILSDFSLWISANTARSAGKGETTKFEFTKAAQLTAVENDSSAYGSRTSPCQRMFRSLPNLIWHITTSFVSMTTEEDINFEIIYSVGTGSTIVACTPLDSGLVLGLDNCEVLSLTLNKGRQSELLVRLPSAPLAFCTSTSTRGLLLAGCEDGGVRLVDLHGRRVLKTILRHTAPVTAVHCQQTSFITAAMGDFTLAGCFQQNRVVRSLADLLPADEGEDTPAI